MRLWANHNGLQQYTEIKIRLSLAVLPISLRSLIGTRGASARLRLPPPLQPKASSMPPDQCVRLNDDQSLSPREESGKQYQGQAGVSVARRGFTLRSR